MRSEMAAFFFFVVPLQKIIKTMTKETYYKATELMKQINQLEESLMAHFNGGQSPDVNFMVTRLGKTQGEAIDYVKSSLREKYREFEKL